MHGMRVRVGFAAVWVATTAAGVAISWAGVSDAVRGAAATGPEPAADVPVLRGRPPVPSQSPARSPSPSPTGARASVRPSPRPATATPSPRATPPPDGQVRTYTVRSGRVTLSIGRSSARFVSATPDSGFQARTWNAAGWLRVDLTDGRHGSAVFATWNGHAPQVQVYEY
ncbi:hypothetical protein GCM10009678_67870 [Actinomadura kijaniata]